ncbi:MAG: hypothetical protein ACIARR_06605 [Phycisphaerales bacterium JB059]
MSRATPSRARWLARQLDPRALFFGPIFQKDMRIAGRKSGVYVGRSLFALVLALVISVAFYNAWTTATLGASQSGRVQALQNIAPIIVIAVLWVQFTAMLFLAPMLTGGAICDERRAQTLPALLTTPLSPLQIVCSKGASRLTQLIIIALLSVPVLLGVRLFGGVRAETVLAGASLALATAILAGSFGLWFSVRATRSTTAALVAYCALGIVLAGLPLLAFAINMILARYFPALSLRDMLGPSAPDLPLRIPAPVIWASSPPMALAALSAGAEFALNVRTVWIGSLLWTLLLSLFNIAMASLSLRGVMRRSLGAPRLSRTQRRQRRKAARTGEPIPDEAVPLRARRSREVGAHPVLWREIRQSLFPNRSMLIAAILGVIIIGAIMYLSVGRDRVSLVFAPLLVGSILILLQAALLSSAGFAAEREARTLDVLLTTRLQPAPLVFGKMLGAIRRQWFLPLVLLLHVVIVAALGEIHPIVFVHLAISFAAPIVMLSGTGVYFGLRCAKSITASAMNLSIALALWLIFPITVGVLVSVLQLEDDSVAEFLAHIIIFTHPVPQAVVAVEGAHANAGEALRSLEYDVVDLDLGAFSYTFYLLCSAAAQATVGLLAALAAVLRFEKHTGRTP